MAETQNVAQTALEAGNSPRVVFSNYRELVRPADAKVWFGITPKSVQAWKGSRKSTGQSADAVPSNIVPLPAAAVA